MPTPAEKNLTVGPTRKPATTTSELDQQRWAVAVQPHSFPHCLPTQFAMPSTNRLLWPGFILMPSAITPASSFVKSCSEAIES